MSKFLKLKYIFIFFIFAFVTQAFSQNKDFFIWNELAIKKSVNKKVSLIFEQDIRLQNNATMFKDYVTVVGSEYKFHKKVKLRVSYRYTHSNDIEDGIGGEHRFYTDLKLSNKIERLSFYYRARYQLKFEQFDINRLHHFRNRFTIKYNIPKVPLMPYIEYEFYYSLNNPVHNSIDRSRYTVGLEYNIFNYMSVYTFYRLLLRREYLKVPFNKYILGLGLSFKV